MNAAIKSKNLKLSVAVAAPDDGLIIRRFLNQLLIQSKQLHSEDIEIVVAHNLSERESAKFELEVPSPIVKFACSKNRSYTLPELWAAAVERSTGDVIAITDSSCGIPPDWINAIRTAHNAEQKVIGGAVENSENGNLIKWAAYFCEYGQFMKPVPSGVVEVLPGNNISFKRDLLQTRSRFVRGEFWKSHLCTELRREGVELISDPSIVINYGKTYTLGEFLLRRFLHGRCFAGMRIESAGLARRLIFAAGTVILPLVFLVRTAKPVLQKQKFLWKFIISLPISLLAILSWSIGETFGYLAGRGNSNQNIY